MDYKKLKILVTGGNGFLGSAIVHSLIEKHEIVVLEKNRGNINRLEDIIERIRIYFSDDQDTSLLFENSAIDVIIHTATLYGRTDISLADMIYSNIYMPVRLLEEGMKTGLKAFINTDTFFNHENSAYKYLGSYTLSKKHVNEWLIVQSDKMPIINMKLQHMYGPGDNMDKFVMQMAKILKSNAAYLDLTSGEQVRDFIFIDDVVDAYNKILEKLGCFNNGFHQLNVGCGKEVTIKEFIEKIKGITKASTKLKFGAVPYRENEIMHSIADINALRNMGWEPKINIETGIKRIIETI
ncbi:MAG: NAD-dependent epimerase/dehydratase family protein [Bacteroidales bacterium]|nr:NAD-dependent epimerase/dehydratase family protein [Bacteroidales bacterium]